MLTSLNFNRSIAFLTTVKVFKPMGLKTLTVVKNAIDLLKLRDVNIDIDSIPLDDKATYDLYSSAKTVAVFQVESAGMMDALRRMRPTSIEDIVALVALYRPGPMENIPAYCEVKNGQRSLQSIHPLIDYILEETHEFLLKCNLLEGGLIVSCAARF